MWFAVGFDEHLYAHVPTHLPTSLRTCTHEGPVVLTKGSISSQDIGLEMTVLSKKQSICTRTKSQVVNVSFSRGSVVVLG